MHFLRQSLSRRADTCPNYYSNIKRNPSQNFSNLEASVRKTFIGGTRFCEKRRFQLKLEGITRFSGFTLTGYVFGIDETKPDVYEYFIWELSFPAQSATV